MNKLWHAIRKVEDALDEQLTEVRLLQFTMSQLREECRGIESSLGKFRGELTQAKAQSGRLGRTSRNLERIMSGAA
tara:strand:- start:325 stop:552 length:228 start_codon:yes stop_codon:yes gene_type:complete